LKVKIEDDLPEKHGLSSRSLLQFFAKIDRLQLDMNSFMLLKDGKAVARFWRKPYREDCRQLLFSLSKSFTSIAAGIAWDSGYLDLHDKVNFFFPDKLPANVSTNSDQMTIHHLLSMNTGHYSNIYAAVANEQDWIKAFLSLDVQHEPGSYYLYNTHATYMLAAIIERATGQNLVDFLMPRLFEPLGIPRPSWETCPMGITAGGMGLSIATEGIAKFGQMLLGKGIYNGQRIVSESYIDLAVQEQSDNRRNEDRIDFAQGYGYQFFVCRHGCFMGNGAFGQLCFVAPKEQIVIAATASLKSKQLQILLDCIYEHIIDRPDQDLSPRPDEYSVLQHNLERMTYPVPTPQPVPANVPDLSNHCYTMDENPHHLQKICFSLQKKNLECQLIFKGKAARCLVFDFEKPVHTKDLFTKDLSLHLQEVVTYAVWQNSGTLKLTLLYIETPYAASYTVHFINECIELEFDINVSLNIQRYKAMGRLIS
jgi:CubicO group peptidase (beta-lactamase class C family)